MWGMVPLSALGWFVLDRGTILTGPGIQPFDYIVGGAGVVFILGALAVGLGAIVGRRNSMYIRKTLDLPRFPADAIAELRHKQELLEAAYQAALVDGIAFEPAPSVAVAPPGGAIDVAN